MNWEPLALPTFCEPGIEVSIVPDPDAELELDEPEPEDDDEEEEEPVLAGAGAALAAEVGCSPRRACAALSLGWALPKPHC
jgi:hypothetical protein